VNICGEEAEHEGDTKSTEKRLAPTDSLSFVFQLCAFIFLGRAMIRIARWLPLLAVLVQPALSQQEPERPELPPGLGSEPPPLPAGLGAETETGKQESRRDAHGRFARLAETFTGFWEARAGVRLRSDPNQRSLALGETRLQLSRDGYLGQAIIRATTDLVYDEVADDHRLQPEQGRGWLDLRELYYGTPVGESADLRVGRQVLTWGVGDLLFLNDLFPKDWNSFFAGREVEYLKAPSDALKLAFYHPTFNLDLVYTPKFDPDRFLDNRRLSFFDPRFGRVVGDDVAFRPDRPSAWFDDDEVALRLHRLVGGWELAGYGYRGFWKSPAGLDPGSGRPLFPELTAWGASVRGPWHSGIFSAETSWYRSRDDLSGSDPLLPNSQFRLLVGYEQELVPDLMLGGQYYLERTLDFDALERNQPPGGPAPDENRHLLTVRITLLTHGQNVTWSLFTFASPSDDDAYLRGSWAWKATDRWTVSTGVNLFEGRRDSSFFGQFERNTNAWAALRLGF